MLIWGWDSSIVVYASMGVLCLSVHEWNLYVCVCVRALQLSCASDMWLIRCHQCVFEMGCFIHSHPIAYIFNSSPRETHGGWGGGGGGRLGWVKAKEIQKEWYGSDRGGVEWVGWGGGRKSKEKRGVGGEKLNVNSSLSKEYPYQNQEYVWICKQQSRVMFIILHRRCQSRKK